MFAPNGLIDNNSTLVQVMASYRTDAKLLPAPMLARFTYRYMHHIEKSLGRIRNIHLMVISQKMQRIYILDMGLRITDSRLQPHLRGHNKLIALLGLFG